ncbi:MAG: nitrogenase cofactor biosynthesis protein NifB [Nitrospirae bacterium]|nr:nitrogenase cofactor biosynthesis protein NifB [Nitrospirota bacterium]
MELPMLNTAPQGGGCEVSGSCGSSKGPADMDPATWEKVKNHPCYSEEAHHHYARMHVAVAPACNIQCHYCNRKYDCANESRPGVVSEKLTPEQASRKVLAVASEIPQMTVLGIAGPGDALANPEKTFRTFAMIQREAPDIKLCLSTNGLRLPEFVDTIAAYRVDHVTITINHVDPRVGAQIYPWIFWDNKRRHGEEAAAILSAQQQKGLGMLVERGILVKVNSVMIPGVNDRHLVEVNRVVKGNGAFLHNIMPLISSPEHGTHYGLTGQRGPTARELKALQDQCEEGEMNMMRHCRQCRADAVGLLGEDRSDEFTLEKIERMQVNYDLEKRQAYQQMVEAQRAALFAGQENELAALQAMTTEMAGTLSILAAVATKGEGLINEHFGHAREFQIYEVSRDGAKFVGHRRVDMYCQGGHGEEDTLETVIRAIGDCTAVFVSRIGECPKGELTRAGIDPVDRFAHESIQKGLIAYFRDYASRVAAGEIQHLARGDAEIRSGALVGTKASE